MRDSEEAEELDPCVYGVPDWKAGDNLESPATTICRLTPSDGRKRGSDRGWVAHQFRPETKPEANTNTISSVGYRLLSDWSAPECPVKRRRFNTANLGYSGGCEPEAEVEARPPANIRLSPGKRNLAAPKAFYLHLGESPPSDCRDPLVVIHPSKYEPDE